MAYRAARCNLLVLCRFFARLRPLALPPTLSIAVQRVVREERAHMSFSDYKTPDEEHYGGRRRQRHPKSTSKVRAVPGPGREVLDDVRYNELYHKEQAGAAREKAQKLSLENQHLAAQLAHAQRLKVETDNYLASLREEIDHKSRVIEDLQQTEGELSAQCFQDQQRIDELRRECNEVFPQVMEANKLLTERNAHVDHLTRLLNQRENETIQLRAAAATQAKKTARKTAQTPPPPRRGTRASLAPVRNTGTRTIEIPLDPPSRSNPETHQGKLAATPALAEVFGADLGTVAGLVDQLERLLIGDSVQAKVKTTRRQSGGAIKTLPLGPGRNFANAALRDAVYDKFNVEQADAFAIYNPAEADQVEACEQGIDPPYEHYQWDFNTGYNRSRWNDVMIEKVVDETLEVNGEELARLGVKRHHLEALMAKKLGRYRSSWKVFQPRFVEEQGRMETPKEALARGTQAAEQHQRSAKVTSSKGRKYKTRIIAITLAIEIKTDEATADDIQTWQRLLEMVQLLGEQGMSSEEEDMMEVDDAQMLVYKVKVCILREPSVVEYLRFVDAQAAVFRKNQSGPTPHPRVRTSMAGSSKAPCGLPQSLYSRKWLRKQTPNYIRELKISKETFGLFKAATQRMSL
ncbi:hypothetical protein B0H15DRAFT_796340 [Mycena belliarum]|uniref:Uncharacterized protein n=1 Tax=Mycena belliarum TaxID=1033014 RepID=A0AAD6UE24_9AGAR|nr:hypothetical protein B0H15DRAFT_796340 [Mycena belliae]